MAGLLLFAVLLIGLLMIPFGLPGLWVMAAAILVYSYIGPPGSVGVATVVLIAGLALVGEILEFVLAGRFAKRYGGSRRAGWGAILGSIVGAIVGVPVPIVGSLVGAFLGAFAGAWLAEISGGTELRSATRVATGALLGRIAAVAAKVGVGTAIVAWMAISLLVLH